MAYSKETLDNMRRLADKGTITEDRYNEIVKSDLDERTPAYIAPGFTSWGTRLTGGQTREQADTSAYNQNIQSITDQLSNLGYNSATPITPSTNYNVGAGGAMTPVATQPVAGAVSPVASSMPIVNTNTPVTGNATAGANTGVGGLLNAQYNQGVNSLDYARNTALGNIADERARIRPYYYDERNRYASQQALARRAELERQASQGLGGGVSTQGEIARGVALQGALSGIGRDETSALADIERQKAQVQNQYAFGVSDLKSQQDIAQMEYDLEQQAIADAQDLQDEDNTLLNQYFAEMVSSGNADKWLQDNASIIGFDMVNKLKGMAGMFTPEVAGVGGGEQPMTPEQNIAYNLLGDKILTESTDNPELLLATLRRLSST